jgi:hypothetical protein
MQERESVRGPHLRQSARRMGRRRDFGLLNERNERLSRMHADRRGKTRRTYVKRWQNRHGFGPHQTRQRLKVSARHFRTNLKRRGKRSRQGEDHHQNGGQLAVQDNATHAPHVHHNTHIHYHTSMGGPCL